MQLPLGILFIAVAVIGGYFILTGKFPPSLPATGLATEVAGNGNGNNTSPGGGGTGGGNLSIGSGGMSLQSAIRATRGGFR